MKYVKLNYAYHILLWIILIYVYIIYLCILVGSPHDHRTGMASSPSSAILPGEDIVSRAGDDDDDNHMLHNANADEAANEGESSSDDDADHGILSYYSAAGGRDDGALSAADGNVDEDNDINEQQMNKRINGDEEDDAGKGDGATFNEGRAAYLQ